LPPIGPGKAFREGIDLLSTLGSINPLVFVGLKVLHEAVEKAWTTLKENKKAGGDVDEKAPGFAIVMYTHVLPRFIASIDGRMRADLWACFHKTPTSSSIRHEILESGEVQSKETVRESNDKKISCLAEERESIAKTCKDIQIFLRTRKLQKPNEDLSNVRSWSESEGQDSGGNGSAPA
jgi:hypothetical protein